VSLTLLNLPTKEIIEKLESGEIDLGVVRSDAISAQLKSKALGRMDFAFFVPKKMVGKASADWRSVLKVCPLAVLEGSGSFRHELQRVAAAEGCEPRIELECSSFPAVARAVRSGNLAAILPAAATDELPKDEFISITAPWLTKLSRPISISWNPRTILIRREIEDVYPVVTKIWTSR
jgi:DNA-binding transcriptional LysR family regulator